jgi:ribonuclease HII
MIVGIDEVGRGSWAGPLVAAAVVLDNPLSGLKDSKDLTALQRRRLAHIIRRHALGIGIGWVPAGEIDKYGLSQAIRFAMHQALEQITVLYERVIIDGNYNFLDTDDSEAIVRADNTVPAVSAASIIAKVARDQYMYTMSFKFPQFQFDKHVGYGTTLHRESLRKHGICSLHRLSFRPIRQILGSI